LCAEMPEQPRSIGRLIGGIRLLQPETSAQDLGRIVDRHSSVEPRWLLAGEVINMTLDYWPSSAQTPPLDSLEVHLWRIKVEATVSHAAVALLSADERSRATTFHRDIDRRRFVTGRGALRWLVGGYLNAPPNALCFTSGKYGKPQLVATPG